MNVFDLFDKNSCNIAGKHGSDKWSWEEYIHNKAELKKQGVQVVLVNMIGQQLPSAIDISNEIFQEGKYPQGTHFVLYCHSGGSSGYVQKQLQPQCKNYVIINLAGGIGALSPELRKQL